MAKDTTGRLHVTVKSGGKRKLSSKLWLERQLNDPYVAQAKKDGLRSRAAYKLIEIDDKHHFLKHGITVVDLGAAPGGRDRIGALHRTGHPLVETRPSRDSRAGPARYLRLRRQKRSTGSEKRLRRAISPVSEVPLR